MRWICLLHFIGCMYMDTAVAESSNFTFTYSMAMKCKEHISQHGYSYETFYRVDDRSNTQTMVKEVSNVINLEMHIAIQAASNGHILLSPVPKPGANDPVYEIVVGGGGNRFTELRRNLKRNARSSAKTLGILSTIELRAFYIKISSDGLIEFGREGDILPLLSYYDIFPLQINYFSFASWTGVEAKFLYDCPAPGDETQTSPDSQAIEPKLSNSDELKRTILMARMPSVPPGPTVSVKIAAIVTNVRYDALESKMFTRMAVVMSWTDNSMAWNPNKFNGTTSINFRQGQIWRPTFFAYNSDNIGTLDIKNPDLISMLYSGEATFHFQTEVTTLCHDDAINLSKWPHDTYSCSIIIEPWEVHEKISIELMDIKDNKTKMFTDIDEFVQSEWDITIEQAVIKPTLWDMVFTNGDNQTHQSDRLFINIELQRHAKSYNIVFYTPLLVLTTFVLLTFWSEPLKISRLWFYTGCVIVVCMGLCNIDYLIPTHTVPSILVLYTTVLTGILIALLIHVLLMSAIADKLCKSATMQALLTARLLRTVFCLPEMKISVNGGYAIQEDDESGLTASTTSNVEEMEREEEKTFGDKRELAEVIDKIMFIAYSITFAVMLAAHF